MFNQFSCRYSPEIRLSMWRYVGATFLFIQFFAVGVAQTIHMNGVTPRMLESNDLLVLKTTTRISIDSATKAAFFRPTAKIPNLGVTKGEAWVKFSVTNAGGGSDNLFKLTNPNFDEVTLYSFSGQSVLVDSVLITKDKPFSDRKYLDVNYLFDLNVPSGETRDFYVRIKSKMPLIIPIYIVTPQQHVSSVTREYLISGIYIGIVLIMGIYNFCLYLSTQDKNYLYYICYVFGAGFTQMGIKGMSFQFFWPNNPEFENYNIVLFGSLTGIAALLFTINFLDVRRNFKGIYFILLGFISLFIGALIALFFDRYIAFSIMQSSTTLSSVGVLLISAYVVYRQPNISSSTIFLGAWSILLLGSLVFLFKDYGILPYNMFTVYSVQAASGIEMALLSLALANKINIYKKEKEESRARELVMIEENAKLVREQNIVLEQRVEERTHALKESNESLEQTLTHLKETQTQLVESEKMASLGQLTAGVAHEINNPINFVTSNVAPLKRDINMIWNVLDEVERIALADDIPFEEKEQRIQAYKEDLDVPYLKTEIDFLLKGMHEGATRTAEIVKSLRIFSRVDEESLKFADINEGLESTLVILNSVIKEGITVVKEFGDLPPVECYPGKLNQVFLNIITNGIYAINKKFDGNPGGVLEIQTRVDAENALITIRDNGVGMPDEVIEKMFEPFFTTKEVGEGTGLGMSIVYNTIKKHAGEIKVDSSVGEGVSFLIIIPLKQQM
ncbi:sensor histidine kinase [Parapedobacter sp. 10938]|uniref:sensor histidine kinase n=1 Tax=Parapedobacter flavus TaxID=3110225 RepID=UPI002DBBCB11|nr:7TM diverse intracellular signaling domain-containing protein [Parapedobacter sp. 10938]MEC3879556.1 7TM diverse intracellular signaling domain-containing protein [Parapedobacter sp. 10938]